MKSVRNPLFPAMVLLAAAIALLAATARFVTTLPEPTPFPTLPSPTHTRQPSPTLTSTVTVTPTSSPRPTWTRRPSETLANTPTPSPTSSETPLPSLTPARPLKINDRYRLKPWTPGEAARLIEQLEAYPESLALPLEEGEEEEAEEGRPIGPEYDAAFYYATVAQREALLRFPNDPAASHWRWGLAYHLARSRGAQAGAQYAGLITAALNARQTTLSGLEDWFSQQEPRMSLNITPLSPAPGYLSNQIIEIVPSGEGLGGSSAYSVGGGAYLWLLESPNGFQAHVLGSHFNFTTGIRSGFSLGDLTRDRITDIVVYYSPEPQGYLIQLPNVWSLAQVPPAALPFEPALPFSVGLEYTSEWTVIPQSQGDALLRFTGRLFPSCPALLRRDYRWTGELFKLTGEPQPFARTQFEIQPSPGLLGFCEYTIQHAALFWGPEATAQMMETLLPAWPPEVDVEGRPYSRDALDEFRFRLGVTHALAGNREAALERLQKVAQEPTDLASRWIEPARTFLQAYQSSQDVYRACVRVPDCDPRQALRQLAAAIPLEDFDRAPQFLAEHGVMLRSSSIFDFDDDGEMERWFLARHREGQKLELWILARWPQAAQVTGGRSRGVKALFVQVTNSADYKPYYHNPEEQPRVFQVRRGEGWILRRASSYGEPYLQYVDVEFVPTTYTLDTLNAAEKALFDREDPAQIAKTLASLAEDSSRFNCLNYRICDRYYYILGLAYELAGQEREAIDWYVRLWWEYSRSPYTIMARLKLATIPTRTALPSRTPTITNTLNPNITPTITPSHTPTPDPNATPTRTPTATNTGEPYPPPGTTPPYPPP